LNADEKTKKVFWAFFRQSPVPFVEAHQVRVSVQTACEAHTNFVLTPRAAWACLVSNVPPDLRGSVVDVLPE